MALIMAGCMNVHPIYNVPDRMFSGSAKRLSQEELRTLVIATALKRGWQFSVLSHDKLEGRLHVRTHTATVRVRIDQVSFSISYVSSDNLNESGGNIARNYNRWIRNLERDISAAVLTASLNRT